MTWTHDPPAADLDSDPALIWCGFVPDLGRTRSRVNCCLGRALVGKGVIRAVCVWQREESFQKCPFRSNKCFRQTYSIRLSSHKVKHRTELYTSVTQPAQTLTTVTVYIVINAYIAKLLNTSYLSTAVDKANISKLLNTSYLSTAVAKANITKLLNTSYLPTAVAAFALVNSAAYTRHPVTEAFSRPLCCLLTVCVCGVCHSLSLQLLCHIQV